MQVKTITSHYCHLTEIRFDFLEDFIFTILSHVVFKSFNVIAVGKEAIQKVDWFLWESLTGSEKLAPKGILHKYLHQEPTSIWGYH